MKTQLLIKKTDVQKWSSSSEMEKDIVQMKRKPNEKMITYFAWI